MAYARLVTWRLKPGRREEALEVFDRFSEEAKKINGFLGIFAFNSMDESNTAYVLSLWSSMESLNLANEEIFKPVMESVSDISLEHPVVKILETKELAGQTIRIPA